VSAPYVSDSEDHASWGVPPALRLDIRMAPPLRGDPINTTRAIGSVSKLYSIVQVVL
jgi:hypothetical protein